MNKHIYKCKYILIAPSVYFSDDILPVMAFRALMPPMPPDDPPPMPPMPPSPIMAAMLAASNMGLEDWEDVEEELVQLPPPCWVPQLPPCDWPPPPPPLLEKWGLGSQEGLFEDWPEKGKQLNYEILNCKIAFKFF